MWFIAVPLDLQQYIDEQLQFNHINSVRCKQFDSKLHLLYYFIQRCFSTVFIICFIKLAQHSCAGQFLFEAFVYSTIWLLQEGYAQNLQNKKPQKFESFWKPSRKKKRKQRTQHRIEP